jgi:predicted ATP-dependent endonuclease of OLD family
MHISKLTLVNYRNFKNTSLQFHKGVNTIIGENGSGKSNILRAIRLLLDDTMVRAAYRLDESDFSRSLGQWQGHWIIISMEFEEITADESVQALFLHGTAPLDAGPIHKATYNLIFRPKKDIRLKLAALDVFEDEQLTRSLMQSQSMIMKLFSPDGAGRTSAILRCTKKLLAISIIVSSRQRRSFQKSGQRCPVFFPLRRRYR